MLDLRSRSPAPGAPVATSALAVGLFAVLLALLEAAVHYRPHTWINRDGRFYTNVNVTLLERASFEQSAFCASWYRGDLGWNANLDASWSNVAIGRAGRVLPKHPVLMPLLSTPFFWAFGLPGTLLFNLLLVGAIAAAAFVFASRFASGPSAAFSALALVFATGIRTHVYDYHVDILNLALFLFGLSALVSGHGWRSGLLLGLTVVIRPTGLVYLPAAALLATGLERRAVLLRAMLAGTLVLLLLGLFNCWLFGRPWWFGYNRILTVVGGEPAVGLPGNAFSLSWVQGAQNLWQGPYGVSHRLTLPLLALAFALVSAVRATSRWGLGRPHARYAAAAVVCAACGLLCFTTYRWFGDRFLWPAAGFLAPAVALALDTAAARLRRPRFGIPFAGGVLLLATAMLSDRFAGRAVDAGALASGLSAVHVAAPCLAIGLLSAGLAAAASRLHAGPAERGTRYALLAPLGLLLTPGALALAMRGEPDLYAAAALSLALASRRRWLHLGALALSALLLGASLAGLLPLAFPMSSPPLPGAARIRLVLAPLSLAGVALGFAARPWRVRLSILGLCPPALLALVGLESAAWPLLSLSLLWLCASAAVRPAVVGWSRLRAVRFGPPLWAWAAMALLLLGALRRVERPPFQLATKAAVRAARVSLGDVPCDFLAWEHFNWECATLDRGVHGETGLSTSAPLSVGGRARSMLLISALPGRPRTLRWPAMTAGRIFELRFAVPDRFARPAATGAIELRVDGQVLASLRPQADGRVHRARIDTTSFEGKSVTLALSFLGPPQAVLVDGGFLQR